jgi:hypothetical protein
VSSPSTEPFGKRCGRNDEFDAWRRDANPQQWRIGVCSWQRGRDLSRDAAASEVLALRRWARRPQPLRAVKAVVGLGASTSGKRMRHRFQVFKKQNMIFLSN